MYFLIDEIEGNDDDEFRYEPETQKNKGEGLLGLTPESGQTIGGRDPDNQGDQHRSRRYQQGIEYAFEVFGRPQLHQLILRFAARYFPEIEYIGIVIEGKF